MTWKQAAAVLVLLAVMALATWVRWWSERSTYHPDEDETRWHG
jgi:hypothetical protein